MILSTIIPVYQCEACLVALYERIVRSIQTLDGVTDYEIIFVEDYGQDDSWKKIEMLADMDARVRGIQFSRNFGQHRSIAVGIELWVVLILK